MHKPSPKVSIIMAVYNGGHYFEEALQSALAQTYNNIEIVIVNDGSTDETDSIARRYAAQSGKIKYTTQHNAGVGAALNKALEIMAGDIFTWLSHDDLYEPNKTEAQVNFYNRLHALTGRESMIFSDWTIIGPSGERIRDVVYDHASFLKTPMLALLTGAINGCTVFIPAHLMRQAGGFDPRYRHCQDYHLWNVLLRNHEFMHMPEKLVRYRHHPGQDSMKPDAVTEGNPLWIKMMDDRSEIERVQMFGSSYLFFTSMARHLRTSPYQEAAHYADMRAEQCLTSTMVSVLVPYTDDAELGRLSIHDQTYPHIEIIPIDCGSDYAVRMTDALRTVSGDYVVIADPDAVDEAHRIRRQLLEILVSGDLVSIFGYIKDGRSVTVPSGKFLTPSIMAGLDVPLHCTMFHSSLISTGTMFAPGPRDDANTIAHLVNSGSVRVNSEPLTIFYA